jgi:hypothetical protein
MRQCQLQAFLAFNREFEMTLSSETLRSDKSGCRQKNRKCSPKKAQPAGTYESNRSQPEISVQSVLGNGLLAE